MTALSVLRVRVELCLWQQRYKGAAATHTCAYVFNLIASLVSFANLCYASQAMLSVAAWSGYVGLAWRSVARNGSALLALLA